MKIDLTKLPTGKEALIVEIQSGTGLARKLEHMGIREGKTLKKVSSHFLRGPQTVRVDNFNVAIGFGMAKKIIVEYEQQGFEKNSSYR